MDETLPWAAAPGEAVLRMPDQRPVGGLVALHGASDGAARQPLFDGLTPVLPPLLGNVASLASVTTDRIAGLEEGLVTIPYALASAITPGRDERAHFSFQGTQEPQVCRRGYVPARQWRSPHDTSYEPMDDRIGCTQRGTTLPRGSNSELDRDPQGRVR